MFLLDTDVLSSLRKERKHPAVLRWVQSINPTDLATSVITIAELQCGIERQMPHNPTYAQETQRWLDGILAVGGFRVFELRVQAALLLARMHETPRLRNFVLPDARQKKARTPADLAIAAIAIAEGAVVASGNRAHFEEINAVFPLAGCYDPFCETWAIPKPL